MATKKEVDAHLKMALQEIGEIEPWFDREVGEWVFCHKLYPVEYAGASEKEVVQNFPKYLRECIRHRLNQRLNPLVEESTEGLAGAWVRVQEKYGELFHRLAEK